MKTLEQLERDENESKWRAEVLARLDQIIRLLKLATPDRMPDRMPYERQTNE